MDEMKISSKFTRMLLSKLPIFNHYAGVYGANEFNNARFDIEKI